MERNEITPVNVKRIIWIGFSISVVIVSNGHGYYGIGRKMVNTTVYGIQHLVLQHRGNIPLPELTAHGSGIKIPVQRLTVQWGTLYQVFRKTTICWCLFKITIQTVNCRGQRTGAFKLYLGGSMQAGEQEGQT